MISQVLFQGAQVGGIFVDANGKQWPITARMEGNPMPILTLDTPSNLVSRYVGKEVGEIEVNPEEMDSTIRTMVSNGLDFEYAGNRIYVFHVPADKFSKGPADLSARIKRRAATLEDVFLRLTGRYLSGTVGLTRVIYRLYWTGRSPLPAEPRTSLLSME